MQSLFQWVVVGIACAIIGRSQESTPATPPLADFGYGTMITNASIYNAIILVNFTNNHGITPYTVPYKMGATLVNTNYQAAEHYYSNWFFCQTTVPETLNGYFRELSNGRFQWLPARVCMVLMDTNNVHGAFMARLDTDGKSGWKADKAYMDLMIGQAMAQGFDLLSYDSASKGGDGNGTVTPRECTIQLITNDETFGGGARGWVGLPSVAYTGDVTIQRYNLGLRVLAEELIHVLQAGPPGDIYGPSGMSDGFTTMSGGNVLHVDAWHKLQLGWSEPRIYSMLQSTQFTLSAAQLMDPTGPVILYDPSSSARHTKEFFLLEYRTTSTTSYGPGYDKSVADSGLVIWHVQQDGNKHPVNYTTTYYPSAEGNWWRCSKCFSLFNHHGDFQPCAADAAGHTEDDGHIALACNDASAGGVPEWRYCQKCDQLYYQPQASLSVCAGGGLHEPGTCNYRLRHYDDPEALGQPGWFHCAKCQSLFKPLVYLEDKQSKTNWGVCTARDAHAPGANTNSYIVLWTEGVKAMMTEGSPNLMRSRGEAWHSGDHTPFLRWYDGTSSSARIAVLPFKAKADTITIEIQSNYDIWVDFRYGGTEDGSFAQPFNTFAEGVNAVYPQGNLHIKTGTSPEKGHVGKGMRIEAYGGRVTLGRP